MQIDEKLILQCLIELNKNTQAKKYIKIITKGKSTELVDKKKRLLFIKDFLGDKLKSPEGNYKTLFKRSSY